MPRYSKTLFVLFSLIGLATISIIARPNRFKKPNDFKNLKVYPKDVSQEKLEKDMDLFAASLDVDCGYCHAHEGDNWDFASDTKPKKEEARDMMRMTNTINDTYFKVNLQAQNPNYAVTCYTCHRNEENPIIPWDSAHVSKKISTAFNSFLH